MSSLSVGSCLGRHCRVRSGGVIKRNFVVDHQIDLKERVIRVVKRKKFWEDICLWRVGVWIDNLRLKNIVGDPLVLRHVWKKMLHLGGRRGIKTLQLGKRCDWNSSGCQQSPIIDELQSSVKRFFGDGMRSKAAGFDQERNRGTANDANLTVQFRRKI